MKRYFFILLFLGAFQAKGQTSGDDNLGNWLMFFGNSQLSEKYSLHTEAQLRLYEPFQNFNQLLLRVGLNYRTSPVSMISAGYGYIPTESFDKELFRTRSIEHRLWEQLILTNVVGRLFFEHRYRVEQRWITSNLVASSGLENQYLNRLRYRILVNIPLNNTEMTDNTLFASFYNEVFLNVTETPFDQNRLFGALGFKFNRAVSIQGGYLRHRLGANNFNRLQMALFLNTDFSKSAGKAK